VPPRITPFAVLLALTIACSGDDASSAPTATLFPELAASPGGTSVPPPVPTERPPLTEVPGVIWLIDVAAESVVTLDADPEHSVANAWFDEETGTVVFQPLRNGRSVSIRTELDGTELERADHIQPPFAGPPQTRWQLSRLPAGEVESNGAIFDLSDLWVEDTETGERMLLAAGLWQCTACDAFSSPAWSPSGRYVTYREHGGENRVFLSDLQAGTTREITVERVDRTPRWSPTADLLLRPSADGVTVLEDLAAEKEEDLPNVPWPAAFDPSGAYIYSLAFGTETVIAAASNGDVVARLEGSAVHDALLEGQRTLGAPTLDVPHPVIGIAGGFVAVVGGAADCHGALVYASEKPLTCVEDGGGAVISPDGARIALARRTGETGRVDAPTIQAVSLDIYEIIVVDVAGAEVRSLAQGALGFRTPPQIVWNASGTHVLVRWPFHGYGP
jgi:hypothetical protein